MSSPHKEIVHEITILVATRLGPTFRDESHFSLLIRHKDFVHGIIGSRVPFGSGFFYLPPEMNWLTELIIAYASDLNPC